MSEMNEIDQNLYSKSVVENRSDQSKAAKARRE